MMGNIKLIHFKTKKKFEEELNTGNISDAHICFILDSKLVYTHGTIYNGNEFDYQNLKDIIKDCILYNYYYVYLKPDGHVDQYPIELDYQKIKQNLTDPYTTDILCVTWENSKFYVKADETINNGQSDDIKFITDVEHQGIQRRIVFNLDDKSNLITTSITTNEIVSNKINVIPTDLTNMDLYPSAVAVNTEFIRKPVVIYNDPVGFEANDEDVGNWLLSGLDLKPYTKLKFYVSSAGSDDTNWNTSHIVEMHLYDRARGNNNHFTAGHTSVCPNHTSRFHNVVFSVNADKTALAFNRSTRYSISTSANSREKRYCYLIEGYY